jgi:hypothetical protein
MSETQWKQFVQLFAEKNQHLSKQQVLQMAKKPFQELQKHFSQRGGANRDITIQSMIRDDIELHIDAKDTKLTVGDLKRLIAAESGIETYRQKLIHWTGAWRDGAFDVLDNSEKLNSKKLKSVTRLDLLVGSGMCEIVSIEDDAKYPGTYEMPDAPCRLWTFALENGEEFKVYRTNRPKGRREFTNYLIHLKNGRTGNYQNIKDLLGYAGPDFGVTARDGFVIEQTLTQKETMPIKYTIPSILVQYVDVPVVLDVYCECGLIADFAKMNGHLRTQRHKTGDEEGRQFMERARAYVSEWTA